jgi:hypothetical protein
MKRSTFTLSTDSRFVRAGVALGGAMLVVWAAGCSDLQPPGSGGGRMTGWSQIRLPDTSPERAFEAGLYAMQQLFPIAKNSPAEGLIRSATVEYDQKGGTGRIRDDAVGYRNRMRRTATLLIVERETGCIAKCRVRVQRLDTADHQVFRRNEQFDDVPRETPIDREAGIRPSQDQVWTDQPRDRELERQIRNLLRSRVMGEDTGSSPQ